MFFPRKNKNEINRLKIAKRKRRKTNSFFLFYLCKIANGSFDGGSYKFIYF